MLSKRSRDKSKIVNQFKPLFKYSHMMERSGIVIKPEQQAEPSQDGRLSDTSESCNQQSQSRSCFTLNITRLSDSYVPSFGLAITPSNPAPSIGETSHAPPRIIRCRGDMKCGAADDNASSSRRS